ncbi:hypothetical protein H5410_054615, partial [Solanum commersonii]
TCASEFSNVVLGSVLHKGIWIPPPGICDVLRFHLEEHEYKMTLPMEPRFTIKQHIRLLAYDYLDFSSPMCLFVSAVRAAWMV